MSSDDLKVNIRPNIIRYKEKKREIPVEATFERVWEQMELFLNYSSFLRFLNTNISNDFYDLNLNNILEKRKKSKITKGNPYRFIKESDIKRHNPKFLQEAIVALKHAKSYFQAAYDVDVLIKPLLLYYGMVNFAKSLIKSTYLGTYYKGNELVNLNHGLYVPNNEPFTIQIKKEGEFQSFRDCYISDTNLYTRKHPLNIHLKDLLSVVPGMSVEWRLAYASSFNDPFGDLENEPLEHEKYFKSPTYRPLRTNLKTNDGEFKVFYDLGDRGELSIARLSPDGIIHKPQWVHIIDIYYLTTFILGHYVRYRPLEWQKFLEKDSNSFLIESFLRRTELDFPMLMYSEFTGIKTSFKSFG